MYYYRYTSTPRRSLKLVRVLSVVFLAAAIGLVLFRYFRSRENYTSPQTAASSTTDETSSPNLKVSNEVVNKYLEDSMYEKFDDKKLEELKQKLSTAIPEIRNVQLSGSNKSFTINKEHIFICTKNANGEYYEDNMLTYVLLHELAHVLCDEIGHTTKFTNIFKDLLNRAENANLYNPKIQPIQNYCES